MPHLSTIVFQDRFLGPRQTDEIGNYEGEFRDLHSGMSSAGDSDVAV